MKKYILLLLCLFIQGTFYSQETVKYTLVNKEFYKGSDGKLYIKTKRLIAPKKYGPAFYRAVPAIDLNTYNDYDEIDAYAKDIYHVYWREITKDGDFIKIIEKADPQSFTVVVPRKLAYDKTFVYQENIVNPKMNRDSLVNVYDLK